MLPSTDKGINMDNTTLTLCAFGLLMIAPELCTIVRELCLIGHNTITGHRIS